jgi:hypothetical protein
LPERARQKGKSIKAGVRSINQKKKKKSFCRKLKKFRESNGKSDIGVGQLHTGK